MINSAKLQEVIAKLSAMTKKKEIEWSGGDLIAWQCNLKGSCIYVWWYQDGKPNISINDANAEGYDLGIHELLVEIRKQKEPPNFKELIKRGENDKTRIAAEKAMAMNAEVEKFLATAPKQKPKRKSR